MARQRGSYQSMFFDALDSVGQAGKTIAANRQAEVENAQNAKRLGIQESQNQREADKFAIEKPGMELEQKRKTADYEKLVQKDMLEKAMAETQGNLEKIREIPLGVRNDVTEGDLTQKVADQYDRLNDRPVGTTWRAQQAAKVKDTQTAEAHASQLATEKAQRGLIGANTTKALTPTETAKDLPIDVKAEVGALSTKNANKISVANQIGSYLEQFRNAKTDDDKARIGGQMLKVLNSPEGADAIGVEEAKRLGDALEYNIFDVKAGLGAKPGNLVGRDLPGFERQVQATYDAIKGSVDQNRSEVGRLLGRPASQPESARTTAPAGGMDRKLLAQQALNDPDATPEEKAQAKRILGIK